MNWSTAAIHLGISGVSPARGRPCHCLTATASSSRPNSSTTTSTAVLVSPLDVGVAGDEQHDHARPPPGRRPSRRRRSGRWCGPAGVPSMRITATIGTGLSATPTADGSRSPIASPSTAGLRRRRTARDRGAPAGAASPRPGDGPGGQNPKSWVQVHVPWCRPTPIVVKPQLRMLARWPDEFIQASCTAWALRWPWAMFSPPGLRVAGGAEPVGERAPVERVVREVVVGRHVVAVGLGRGGDAAVDPQRPAAGVGPGLVRPAPRPGRSPPAGGGGAAARWRAAAVAGPSVGGRRRRRSCVGAWSAGPRCRGGRGGRRRRVGRGGAPVMLGAVAAPLLRPSSPARLGARAAARRRAPSGRLDLVAAVDRTDGEARGDDHADRRQQRDDEHDEQDRRRGRRRRHACAMPLTARPWSDVCAHRHRNVRDNRRPGLGNDRSTSLHPPRWPGRHGEQRRVVIARGGPEQKVARQ